MLKKRLIGVVTIKNGWAVQSFGYGRYLPLGKPECLVDNLDRWGADEILVQVVDRSVMGVGPDFKLIEKLARLGLGTPLIYGGGIRTVDDGVQAIQLGADRLTVDSLLHDDLSVVERLCDRLGAQALIASMPMAMGSRGPELFNYRSKAPATSTANALAETIEQGVVSEVLLTDWRHEGQPNAFDNTLVDLFPYDKVPLIAFGGISNAGQIKGLLEKSSVAAVAVGNFLSYREHAIQQLKEGLASAALRPSMYATEYSLIANV